MPVQYYYGFPAPYGESPVQLVRTNRAPTVNDFAEVGSLWIDRTAHTSYILTDVAGNVPFWVTTPSGGTSAASFVVNPGNLIYL
jgi:hypothetical protein